MNLFQRKSTNFQFFPSCCVSRLHGPGGGASAFQFFPSCCLRKP
ncbi:MAG: hypothetical protein N3E41_08960 [Thermofilaceae archaeon]|nr:hypothetical protein [Thermofilaceae archaeon]